MKALMTAACLATVCAVAADAQGQGQGQGQGQQQGQTQQTTPQQRADQQSVTLSGCLERDTAAAAATTGQAGQTSSQQAFKLTDVTILSGAANIGRTGQTGQQQQQQQRTEDKDKEFRLQASAGVDLSQHVGHEVEVVGRVTGGSTMTTPQPGTAGTTGSGQTGQSQTGQAGQAGQTGQQRAGQGDDKAPLLMVSSIKMTATTCRWKTARLSLRGDRPAAGLPPVTVQRARTSRIYFRTHHKSAVGWVTGIPCERQLHTAVTETLWTRSATCHVSRLQTLVPLLLGWVQQNAAARQ
jgi:hypothetical protein